MDGYLSTPRVTRAADVIMDQIERLILEGKVRPDKSSHLSVAWPKSLMCPADCSRGYTKAEAA